MKKFFLILFLTGGMFLLLSQNEVSWSKRRFLDEPQVHKVRKGESLSKLAKQHYGSTKRWRELALVNRAPKPNHLEVGEEIILPSATVINELRRSRTITRVNTLVAEQESATTAKPAESSTPPAPTQKPAPVTEPTATTATPATNPESNSLVPETTPESIATPEDPATDEASFPWFWLAIGVIMIAGAAGFVWYRRQQTKEAESEVTSMVPRRNFDERSREHQTFTKPAPQKENLTV